MDNTNFWFSSGAAGGGGGDEGDPIGQSLRFRGNGQFLAGPAVNNAQGVDVTFSFWFKKADVMPAANQHMFSMGGSNYCVNPPQGILRLYGGGAADSDTTVMLRDPGAWYHLVIQGNGQNINGRCWLNGQEITNTFNRRDFPSLSNNALNTPFRIGTSPSGTGSWFDGYIADFYCIDGQALLPTDFGRFNDNGIWVPVEYDGDADDYGANGFHLTFADPDDLGEDTAPIGATGHTAANDFTATGFDTDPVGIFSNNLTTSAGGFNSPATNAFNGSSFDSAVSSGTGTMTFAPTNPIVFGGNTFGLQVVIPTGTTASFNGGPAVTSTSGTARTTVAATGELNTTQTLVITNNTANVTLQQVIADNVVLVDNTGTDFDSMQDSPTQNWAVLNPLPPRSSGTIQNANLEADIGSLNQYIWGTQAMTSPCYWETRFVSGDPFEVGLVDIRATTRDSFLGGTGGNTYGYGTNGQITNNAASGATTYTTWGVNDVISQAYDPGTGRWWAAVNGVWVGGGDPAAGTDALHIPPNTGTNDQLPEDQRMWMTPGFGPNVGTSAINFGQQPFLFPVPAGFEALQTQELPTPTILDGSDQFRALTGTGANILAIAQGTNNTGDNWNPDVNTGFTNGLWWIKDMDNANNHQLLDSVRGGNLVLQSNSAGAETTYTIPTGNSVAWCWSAPDTWASTDPDITAGTLASNGRRNVEAGFSIVSYQGNLTAGATVAHGLRDANGAATPDFIAVKNRDGTADEWQCWQTDIGGNEWSLRFNANAERADFNAWNNTAPNNNHIVLGPVTGTNGNGNDMIAYCWTTIPGYSAFGSYTGNTSTDGPFIYTGFRPAFVMLKASTRTGDWVIYDSTRNPTNQTTLSALTPNAPSPEASAGSYGFDILSNGFKVRDAGSTLNQTNQDYIYCCFAENPLGGEDTAPANAR